MHTASTDHSVSLSLALLVCNCAQTVAEGVSKIVNEIRSKYGNMVLPEPTAAHMINLKPEEYIVMATVSP